MKFKDIRYNIMYKLQRAKKGYCDEDYYYNEALEDEYPICKEEFTKEEVENLVIDILKRLLEE